MTLTDTRLAAEAKAIVAVAFRNGPIEDVHAGQACPVCQGMSEYSHITDAEMKTIMQSAVNKVYRLLWNLEHDFKAYQAAVDLGNRFTSRWDDPA